VREGDTESLVAVVPNGVGYRRQHAMPRLVVDVLSTATEPAGCWFHHKKTTPPEAALTEVLTSSPVRLNFVKL